MFVCLEAAIVYLIWLHLARLYSLWVYLLWQLEEDDKPEPVCFVAHASRTDVIQV